MKSYLKKKLIQITLQAGNFFHPIHSFYAFCNQYGGLMISSKLLWITKHNIESYLPVLGLFIAPEMCIVQGQKTREEITKN